MAMSRIHLSPAERFILGTASGMGERIALVHAVQKELSEPNSVKNLRFGFVNLLRYTYLVGLNRQPLFFTLGPIIALLSYGFLVYQILAWIVG